MRHRVADLDASVQNLDFGGTGAPLLKRSQLGGRQPAARHQGHRVAMLMGNSMGGHIAILAAAHPESVRARVRVARELHRHLFLDALAAGTAPKIPSAATAAC